MIFGTLINFENANQHFWMHVMNGYEIHDIYKNVRQ